jgi:hypothetical protein
MNACGEVQKVLLYAVLIIALDGVVQSASCTALFNPRETACDMHGTGSCMGPRASQKIWKKNLLFLAETERRFLNHTDCSPVTIAAILGCILSWLNINIMAQ